MGVLVSDGDRGVEEVALALTYPAGSFALDAKKNRPRMQSE